MATNWIELESLYTYEAKLQKTQRTIWISVISYGNSEQNMEI